MIILPQTRSLQKGSLSNINGNGGALPSGIYRNITGTFSSISNENTEVICQNFNATIINTGYSTNTSYQSIKPVTKNLTFNSYDNIPILTLKAGENGKNGMIGSGGSGAAGGGVTSAGNGGRGGSGGNGADGKHWSEFANTASVYGLGGSGGSGFFGSIGEIGGNGVNGKNGFASYSSVINSIDNSTLSGNYNKIAYGKTIYVAIANLANSINKIITSTDGINWNNVFSPANNYWQGITYAKGIFVVVGNNCSAYSKDGINWNLTSIQNNNWMDVTYGNGVFVAISDNNNNRISYSNNGIDWYQNNISNNTNLAVWSKIHYANNLFVAIAINGINSNKMMTSPNGLNWTIITLPEDNNLINWKCITYGNGIWIIAGSVNGTKRIMTSPDGITWTLQTHYSPSNFISISFSNGIFLLYGSKNEKLLYSTNGSVWKESITLTKDYYASIGINGRFIALSYETVDNSNILLSSPVISGENGEGGETLNKLGDSFSNITGISSTSYSSNIIYGDSVFVRVSATGVNKLNYSTDGVTWVNNTLSDWVDNSNNANLVYGKVNNINSYYAINDNQKLLKSTNGINWTASTIFNNFNSSSVCIGKNMILIGGINNADNNKNILKSSDGITFSNVSLPTTKKVIGLIYGNGLFIAFLNPSSSQDTAIIMTSTNGDTWFVKNSPTVGYFNQKGLAYGNGIFLLVGVNFNNINISMTTIDGENFINRTLPIVNNNLWSLTQFGNGIFLLANSTNASSETERFAISSDAITWTIKSHVANAINNIKSICNNNSKIIAITENSQSGLISSKTATLGGMGGAGGGGGGGGQSIFTRYSYPGWIQQNMDSFKGSKWHGNGGNGASGYIQGSPSGGTSGNTGSILSPTWPATISRSGSGGLMGINSPVSNATIGEEGGNINMGGLFSIPSTGTGGDLGPTPGIASYGGGGVVGANSIKTQNATGTNSGSNGANGGRGGDGTLPSAGGGGGGRGADGQDGALQKDGANGGKGGRGGAGGNGGKPAKSLVLYVHNKVSGSISTFGENGKNGDNGITGEAGETVTHTSGIIYTGASGGYGGTGGPGGQGTAGRITLIGKNGTFNNLNKFCKANGDSGSYISSGNGGETIGATWVSFSSVSNGSSGSNGLPGDPGEGGYISELLPNEDSFHVIY